MYFIQTRNRFKAMNQINVSDDFQVDSQIDVLKASWTKTIPCVCENCELVTIL